MTRLRQRPLAATSFQSSAKQKVMEIRIRMYKKISVLRIIRSSNHAALALLGLGLISLLGCSSNSSTVKPQVGAIAFTDANGSAKTSLTSLTVSQGTYLTVSLTNDPQLLGADWSVSCGSTPPPGTPLPPGQIQDETCGTFTPAHTMSGPLPPYATSGAGYVAFYTAPAAPPKQGTVTLYASATSDHTRLSSVTLTINGLPISIGFAPAPPATLGMGASTQFKVVLNNDSTGAGVNWTALCGSSACGSFSQSQTSSGVLTTYTAPSAIPVGGTVKLIATSIADPTKSTSATIQIVPITISVTPTTLSVGTAGMGLLTATVANDGANMGVDWSLTCTNKTAFSNCGTITSHTSSGAPATYTAPSVANIAVGTPIVVSATSTADPTKSATATVTTIKGNLLTGTVQAVQRPVRDAQVSLYAAISSETEQHSIVNGRNASAVTTATTDRDGTFSIPYGYECPTPDTQMYLVSNGGNAGAGTNSQLSLMVALGPCSDLDAAHIVANEATTVAAVYALSGFMVDTQHIGYGNASSAWLAAAFSTAGDLVDVRTGLARTRTVSGAGIIPQTRIYTLSNLLSFCAGTAGSSPDDGSACDELFRVTNPGKTLTTQANTTAEAALALARNATGFSGRADAFAKLYQLAQSSSSFVPMDLVEPKDWMLAILYQGVTANPSVSNYGISSAADKAGNIWVRAASGNSMTEFVGAEFCSGDQSPTRQLQPDSK
jgi:hypothetical protein